MKSKPCSQAAMQVLNRIPSALPPRPEDSRECVRMRSNEWCPSGRFEVPNSASGRARGHFRQSIIPRFAFLFGLFSVTYLMFVVVLRAGIDLIPRSNPNGRQVFSAPPGLLTRRGHPASAPHRATGAAGSRSSATVMNFCRSPR